MTTDQRDQDAKDRIKEGMAEAGKQPTGQAGEAGGTAGSQRSGGTDDVAEGMAEAGKQPTDPIEEEGQRQPS